MSNKLNSTELLFHITDENNGVQETKVKKSIINLRHLSKKDAEDSINLAIKNKIIKRKKDGILIPLVKSFL